MEAKQRAELAMRNIQTELRTAQNQIKDVRIFLFLYSLICLCKAGVTKYRSCTGCPIISVPIKNLNNFFIYRNILDVNIP